jgi:uncharacterized membrane protein
MSDASHDDPRFHTRYAALIVGLIVVATWLRQATASFWLDELGTAWVTKDGLGQVLDRAFEYHGQSPLYYALVWFTTRLTGRSEFAMRLPSLIAAILGAWLLWRIVRRLVSREAALLSIVGYVAVAAVATAAVDARPYAVTMVLLLAAVDAFTRWIQTGKILHAATFVLFAIATVWSHYLFAPAVLALVAYGWVCRRDGAVSLGRQAVAWGVVVLGTVPLASQLVSLYSRRASLSVPYDGTVQDLLLFMTPPVLAGGIAIGALFARAVTPLTLGPRTSVRGALLLFATWLVVPPLTLVGVSLLTDVNLYSPRYFASIAPAVAALFGWAVSLIEPAKARRVIIVTTAALAILAGSNVLRYGEDWRGASAAEQAVADGDTLVFLHPAFVESAQLDWLEDPARADYLLSPADYYRFDGRLIPMPYMLDDPGAEAYVERLTASLVEGTDRFLLLTRYPFVPYREWWDGRLGPEGWRSETLGSYGSLELIEFTKDGAEPPPS